jgi:vacuolar protein sorting-associated protein 52
VEIYLTGFQSDLGAVSTEIESLQSRSSTMNSKLENRRVVEKLLGSAVEDLSLSPAVVRKIVDGPMDEGWVRALSELDRRAKIIKTKAKESKKVKAMEDLEPLLESLTNKAVERIRDYIVAQIKSLRSPNINAQVIQQQAFLRFKDTYAFLASRQPALAGEICQAYINTMRWYYQSQFTRYETALQSLKLHTIEKADLLGTIDDPSLRRGPRLPPTHDAFSIGRRLDILKNPSSAAISSYVAEEDKSTHHLEAVFRAFNLALVSNVAFEYTFLTHFFSPALSYSTITRAFEGIFAPTFRLGQDLTKSLVENTMDALGIILCVRLTQHFAFDLQRLKVPPGESYINGTSMLLWPRLQIVMDMHAESLRKLTASSPQQSTAPHPVTQRFASLLQGILAVSQESGDDEPLSRSLGRVRSEYEACVTRLGKGMEGRKRERFLYNNFSLVGTILEGQAGKLSEENRRHFSELRRVYGAELN